MRKVIILSIVLLFSSLSAGEWHVDKSKHNVAKYISSVSVMTFEGTTEHVDGYVYWEDGSFIDAKPKIYFEVDLNTLDSGIGKRDVDMREVLQTERWRYATFDGKITDIKPATGENNIYDVTATGKFFVHGKEKEITVKGTISDAGNEIKIKSSFSIFLEDYDVTAPSLVAFIKVAEEIKIELDLNMKNVE